MVKSTSPFPSQLFSLFPLSGVKPEILDTFSYFVAGVRRSLAPFSSVRSLKLFAILWFFL